MSRIGGPICVAAFFLILLTSCRAAAAPPSGLDATPVAGRVERDVSELAPDVHQDLLTVLVTAAQEAIPANTVDPVLQAVDLQRIVFWHDWALAHVVQTTESRMPQGVTHSHMLRYLHRQDDRWRVVEDRELPLDVQRALWGPEDRRCTRYVCLIYRAFDAPFIDEALAGLDGYVLRVAADLGLLLPGSRAFELHLVPVQGPLWATVDGRKTMSPLSLPGIYFEERGMSIGGYLRWGVQEMLAYMLVTEAVGAEQTRARWPCAVEVLAQWERLMAGADSTQIQEIHQHTLQRGQAQGMTAAHFLDPTQLLPCHGRVNERLLFYTFLADRYGRDQMGELLQALYTSDDPALIAEATFGEPIETVQAAWLAWLREAG